MTTLHDTVIVETLLLALFVDLLVQTTSQDRSWTRGGSTGSWPDVMRYYIPAMFELCTECWATYIMLLLCILGLWNPPRRSVGALSWNTHHLSRALRLRYVFHSAFICSHVILHHYVLCVGRVVFRCELKTDVWMSPWRHYAMYWAIGRDLPECMHLQRQTRFSSTLGSNVR